MLLDQAWMLLAQAGNYGAYLVFKLSSQLIAICPFPHSHLHRRSIPPPAFAQQKIWIYLLPKSMCPTLRLIPTAVE